MNLGELIPLLIAFVSLVGALYDLFMKWKKNQRAYGPSSGAVVTVLLVVGAGMVGWIGGRYASKADAGPLEAGIAQRDSAVAATKAQSAANLAEREKSITFFQNQMQILGEELDQLKGRRPGKTTPRVVLYEHANYEGKRFYFAPGDHPNLMLYWFGGKASSIRLQGKVKAVAYEQVNFGGDFLPVDRNMPSLVSSKWDDRIASIKVMTR